MLLKECCLSTSSDRIDYTHLKRFVFYLAIVSTDPHTREHPCRGLHRGIGSSGRLAGPFGLAPVPVREGDSATPSGYHFPITAGNPGLADGRVGRRGAPPPGVAHTSSFVCLFVSLFLFLFAPCPSFPLCRGGSPGCSPILGCRCVAGRNNPLGLH